MAESLNSYIDEINLINVSLVEGRIQDKKLLEELSVDEYYSELVAVYSMKKQQNEALEKASAPSKTNKK